MSDSQQKPWTDHLNAPKIPYGLYVREKEGFAGNLIGSILYGMVIVVFLQCITALFDRFHRRGEPIKWGLVSYTVVMFSVATVCAGTNLHNESVSYIDNREFPGIGGVLPPGPLGYQKFVDPKAIVVVPNLMFFLNNWLADGLLLYRCYVIYSMNLWVIGFPCLMYFVSLAMGIVLIYRSTHPAGSVSFGLPYFSISLSLNVLLTLMIVIRLILYTRGTRTAMGIAGIGGLCKAIVNMLIESSALYTVSSLLVLGSWGTGIRGVFLPILAEIQVIAPLLIIQRVANKSALTKNTIISGRLSSFKVGSRGRSMGGSGAIPGGGPVSFVDEREADSGELGTGVETVTDSCRDKI